MAKMVTPFNGSSVGVPGSPRNVLGMSLRAALMSGNQSLAMASLGRGAQLPQGGVDGGQNDVSVATNQDDDDEQ